MNAGRAETLVVSSNDNPVVIDERLQPRNAVINLRGATGSEIKGEFTSRIGLSRWAASITNARSAMRPRHDPAILTDGSGGNDKARRRRGDAMEIV